MNSKNNNQSNVETWRATSHDTVETQYAASLQDAWRRFVNHSETLDDLKLMVEAIRKGKELNDDAPPTGYVRIKMKREAHRIYARYQRNKKMQTKSAPSPTIVRFRKIWYAAAAALLLGALIPAVQLFMKPKSEQIEQAVVQFVEEVTGRGEIRIIVLPDQTKVTLNVESRLKYPADFAEERSVELQGEAIFDVTHDSDRPFTVATADMNVKVLGTVFDVKAYPDEKLSLVSVASGKVEVETWHAASHQTASYQTASHQTGHAPSLQLGKNQQAKIDKTTGHVEKLTIDAERYLSWYDGVLYFNKTPMKEVVKMLNRSYPRMVFELAEGEYPNLITGKFDIKEMEPMLGLFFRSFGIQYKKAGNKIILYHE